MILRAAAFFIVSLCTAAAAQERVSVATERLIANGALFLAVEQGYFKAEGLDVELRAYPNERTVVEAVAAGTNEFGLTAFTPAAFNLAGRGAIRAIAAQAREKRGYEGNEVIVSNAGYVKGVRKLEDLANTSVAIESLGSAFHYQLGQIASLKGFDLAKLNIRTFYSLDAVARALATNDVDAAILPAQYARELLTASQAKLIAWYSELDEQQLGALFVAPKTIQTKRAMVEKFVRAYARGTADYAVALLRHDRYGKRISDSASQGAAMTIAAYVYPGNSVAAAATVEAGAYYIEPQARLDPADIERQLVWYKAQGLVEPTVDARNVVDPTFIAGR